MKLLRIEIENYKSITEPVTVHFHDALPTVLIGKNGSGKTNILEALYLIARANAAPFGEQNNHEISCMAYLRLERDEFNDLFPSEEYTEEKASFTVRSQGSNLKFNSIESKTLVPRLKKEISDVRELGSKLREALNDYKTQLNAVAHNDRSDVPRGFVLECATNYTWLIHGCQILSDQIEKAIQPLLDSWDKKDSTFIPFPDDLHVFGSHWSFTPVEPFTLRYQEPDFAPFEKGIIEIDRTKLKARIQRINRATKEACEKINRLTEQIRQQAMWLSGLGDQSCECPGALQRFFNNVRTVLGGQCEYLRNESSAVLFQSQEAQTSREFFSASERIRKAYVNYKNRGKDTSEQPDRKTPLTEKELAELTRMLKNSIPAFDRDMYDDITAEYNEQNQLSVVLTEKSGERVSLDDSSAGRRWYYTYYFIKNTLRPGDLFLIDEPAGMLHPLAQKEIQKELSEMASEGYRIVYTTHSPYMIPEQWECVEFVRMTEDGTQTDNKLIKADLIKKFKEEIASDIFDFEEITDLYYKCPPSTVAKNCSMAIKEYIKQKNSCSEEDTKKLCLDDAAVELQISVDTIKSWGRKNHPKSPKLENVVAVSAYTGTPIRELLSVPR